MKRLLIVLALLLLSFPLQAQATDLQEELDTGELEALLPEAAREILQGGGGDAGQAVQKVFREELQNSGGLLKQGIQTMVLVFAALMLCAVCRSLLGAEHAMAVTVAGVLAVATLSFTTFGNLLEMTQETLESMDVLSKALLPVLTAAGCAAGAPASATARYVATSLFSTVLFSVIRLVLMPGTVAAAALYAADAALPDRDLSRLAKLLGSLVKWVLTAILTAFVAYLTVTGILSGSGDASLVKGVKLGISTVVPVVGSVLADAADTVLSAAAIVRGAVGVAGLLGLLAVCVVPFLRLGLGVLLFRFTAAICAPLAEPGHCRLLEGISSAYGLLLAQVGAGSVLLFLSVASAALLPGGGG